MVCQGCGRPLPRVGDRLVNVSQIGSDFFVWNANDALFLRRTYNIVGSFVGSFPPYPQQNDFLALPLVLTSNEVAIGVFYGFIQVWDCSTSNHYTPSMEDDNFARSRERDFEQQRATFTQHRNTQRSMFGTKRRRLEDDTGETCQSAELSNDTANTPLFVRIPLTPSFVPVCDLLASSTSKSNPWDGHHQVTKKQEDRGWWVAASTPWPKVPRTQPESSRLLSELCTSYLEYPFVTQDPEEGIFGISWQSNPKSVTLPSNPVPGVTVNSKQFAVFGDLWHRGHHLTSGMKFGVEFLSYPGDPSRFHAHYCVCIVDELTPLCAADITSRGRLAGAVKKSAVLACVTNSTTTATAITTATATTDFPTSTLVTCTLQPDCCVVCALSCSVRYVTMDWGWA